MNKENLTNGDNIMNKENLTTEDIMGAFIIKALEDGWSDTKIEKYLMDNAFYNYHKKLKPHMRNVIKGQICFVKSL